MQALQNVQAAIIKAAQRVGRNPANIHLIAVTKKKTINEMMPAVNAGQRDFGENYVMEAREKIIALQEFALTWHFLGRIQTNKLFDLVKYFNYIHSVDSLKHAEALSHACQAQNKVMPIFLQVNFEGEASKGGFTRDELPLQLQEISALPHLKIMGLMLIPSPKSIELQAKTFAAFQEYQHDLSQSTGINLPELSMGMSDDFEVAIQAGATYVRIGTMLFGAR